VYLGNSGFTCEHLGYTPMEVLEGARPNRHLFSEQIAEARKDRVLKNQIFNECELVCYSQSILSAEGGNPDKSGQAMCPIVKNS
jgi:hypothetical protein